MSEIPTPLEFPVPPSRKYLLLGLTVAAGLLGCAAFAPIDLGGLGWLCLIPLLVVLGQVDSRQGFWHGWLFGVIFIGGNVAYFGQFGFLPWFAFSAVTAIVLGLFGIVVARLRFVGPTLRVPAIAGAWFLGEIVRAHLGAVGVTFGDLAHSQHAQLGLIQVCSVVGIYGLGFLMALLQAGVATAILAFLPQTWFRPGHPRLFNRDAGRVAVLCFFLMFVVFFAGETAVRRGSARLKQVAETSGIRVATVQAEGSTAGRGVRMGSEESLRRYLEQTRKVGAADLVVWPETAVLAPLNRLPSLERSITGLARQQHLNLLVGATEQRRNLTFNSAFYYRPDGTLQDIYRKMDLVIFGEYVPYRDRFAFFKHYPIRPFDYTPGDSRKLLSTGAFRFSPLICFEAIFPHQTQQVCRLGAEVLVVITSDVWAAKTYELYQHSHMDLFRAIEARKYMIRAATNGVSAIYDPYGTALSEVGYFQDGSAAAKVLPRPALSPYHQLGDWPLLLLSVLELLLALWASRRSNGS